MLMTTDTATPTANSQSKEVSYPCGYPSGRAMTFPLSFYDESRGEKLIKYAVYSFGIVSSIGLGYCAYLLATGQVKPSEKKKLSDAAAIVEQHQPSLHPTAKRSNSIAFKIT